LFVSNYTSLRECISVVNANGKRIALVVDSEQRLSGTVTDGDIRRAILDNISLEETVGKLLDQKTGTKYAQPITAYQDASRTEFLALMQEHNVSHLPIVDQDGRVVDMVMLDQLVAKKDPPFQAVIMAGGYGTRLRPLTEDTPKVMLPVGGQPLLEIIVEQLKQVGIERVHLNLHHQSENIIRHFGDGRDFGVQLTYWTEDSPMGTAGALGFLERPLDTMMVINGDILTQVDFAAMLSFHQEHSADLTVAVQKYQLNVPYGVVECKGAVVRGLSEKPNFSYFINAGIYLLEPSVHELIPRGHRYDMTELIQHMIDDGRSVTAFPIHEEWLDIGQHADYEQAQEMVKDWPSRL